MLAKAIATKYCVVQISVGKISVDQMSAKKYWPNIVQNIVDQIIVSQKLSTK